jgi:hypothetical protein
MLGKSKKGAHIPSSQDSRAIRDKSMTNKCLINRTNILTKEGIKKNLKIILLINPHRQ